MVNRFEFTFPWRIHNPLNGAHGNWMVVSSKRKKDRHAVDPYLLREIVRNNWMVSIKENKSSFHVKLVRISCKAFDDDSLPAAFKSIRDQIAERLGFKDDSDRRIRFSYAWEKSKRGTHEIRVEIDMMGPCNDAG